MYIHNEQETPLPSVSLTHDSIVGRQIPYLTLVFALLITVVAWSQTWIHFNSLEQERFSVRIEQIQSKIKARMLQYEQVLRSGIALHESSTEVTRSEWRTFVGKCEVQRWFPGIQAIGFAVPVPKPDLDSFERRIQKEGFADFHVTPREDREKYTAIKFIEPFDWRNRRAFGYDMYSNPRRRKAMDRAASTGLASISGKITLVQETDEDVQAGILCYLPLYTPGASLATANDRQRALRGWVYAAFRCDDLMAGILGENSRELRLEIYDTDQIASKHMLFDSQPPDVHEELPGPANAADRTLSKVVPIELSGRNWTLRVSSQPEFISTTESIISSLVGLSGAVVSFLLFVVLIAITRQREKAIQLAQQMTVGLRESEIHNRAIVENASEAILSVTTEGIISAANQASHHVFRSETALNGKNFNKLILETTLDELADNQELRTGLEIGMKIKGRRTDGEIFPCRVSVDRVESNNSVYFVVIVRDETARVEAAAALAEQNKMLVDASHRAGKAEVATGVLHNVGNVLNSVNVSASLLRERIEGSPVSFLVEAAKVIEANEQDLETFFAKDPRGRHFPNLLSQLTNNFIKERDAQLRDIAGLSENIDHIKEIVSLQQTSAKGSGAVVRVSPEELFEDALRMDDSEQRWHTTEIEKNFEDVSKLNTRRHDVIQILVNLIRNAHQAIETAGNEEGRIILLIRASNGQVQFVVEDNGSGIDPVNMSKMFQHGFTTKKDGHGFGLHACAIAAQGLGGKLTAASDGLGEGASFTLSLPLEAETVDSMSDKPQQTAEDETKSTATERSEAVGLPVAESLGYIRSTDTSGNV